MERNETIALAHARCTIAWDLLAGPHGVLTGGAACAYWRAQDRIFAELDVSVEEYYTWCEMMENATA